MVQFFRIVIRVLKSAVLLASPQGVFSTVTVHAWSYRCARIGSRNALCGEQRSLAPAYQTQVRPSTASMTLTCGLRHCFHPANVSGSIPRYADILHGYSFKMKLPLFVLAILANIWGSICSSNSLTDLVTWDKYSLMINGTRVFIASAEFHYQRLPVPELWLDVFEKIKANGFNTISVYFFWSYHSPSQGVYDFTSPGKDVQRLFNYAKQAGLWVITRAGPYCNAETNGGALALWGSDGSLGNLRTSDLTYHSAWLPWVQQIGQIIAANQITQGGPVIMNQIENELQETTHSANNTLVQYMEQIEEAFRSVGVVVPSTSNEKGQRSMSWSTDYQDVGGAVNIYGLDSYPGGLSCTNINSGFNLVRNYYQWFSNYSFTQPSFLPEFEGGWFSAWGGGSFYDDCLAEHDPAFADVYYKNNIGQRVTLQSLYMTFGGTNWGHSAAPVV
jgi:hypothetical protein